MYHSPSLSLSLRRRRRYGRPSTCPLEPVSDGGPCQASAATHLLTFPVFPFAWRCVRRCPGACLVCLSVLPARPRSLSCTSFSLPSPPAASLRCRAVSRPLFRSPPHAQRVTENAERERPHTHTHVEKRAPSSPSLCLRFRLRTLLRTSPRLSLRSQVRGCARARLGASCTPAFSLSDTRASGSSHP